MNNIVKNNIFLIGSFIFCFSLISTLSTAFAMDSDDMWKQIKSKVLEAPKDNNSDNQEEKEKAVGELLRKNILKPGDITCKKKHGGFLGCCKKKCGNVMQTDTLNEDKINQLTQGLCKNIAKKRRYKKEIAQLSVQLGYTKSVCDDFEKLAKKAKTTIEYFPK